MYTWSPNLDYSVACVAMPQFAPNITFIVCVLAYLLTEEVHFMHPNVFPNSTLFSLFPAIKTSLSLNTYLKYDRYLCNSSFLFILCR